MREVKISPVLNGWIVTVGCQSVVFQDREVMIGEVDRYIGDPDKVEKEYMAKAKNKMDSDVETGIDPLDSYGTSMDKLLKKRE
jgi:hypothetical protein